MILAHKLAMMIQWGKHKERRIHVLMFCQTLRGSDLGSWGYGVCLTFSGYRVAGPGEIQK